MLAHEVLSYDRKICSLNNACSSLLCFKGKIFELAKLFFVRMKRLGSQGFFGIKFLQKTHDFSFLHFCIVLDMKFDSAIISSQSVVSVCHGKLESTLFFFAFLFQDSEVVSFPVLFTLIVMRNTYTSLYCEYFLSNYLQLFFDELPSQFFKIFRRNNKLADLPKLG